MRGGPGRCRWFDPVECAGVPLAGRPVSTGAACPRAPAPSWAGITDPQCVGGQCPADEAHHDDVALSPGSRGRGEPAAASRVARDRRRARPWARPPGPRSSSQGCTGSGPGSLNGDELVGKRASSRTTAAGTRCMVSACACARARGDRSCPPGAARAARAWPSARPSGRIGGGRAVPPRVHRVTTGEKYERPSGSAGGAAPARSSSTCSCPTADQHRPVPRFRAPYGGLRGEQGCRQRRGAQPGEAQAAPPRGAAARPASGGRGAHRPGPASRSDRLAVALAADLDACLAKVTA